MMMMRALTLAAVLGAGLATPAWAGVGVGDDAPDVAVKEWVKGQVCNSLKDVRGKAVLIEFFATT